MPFPTVSDTTKAAAVVANVEQAFADGKVATVVTMDVQGAFDALLRRRAIANMRKQGWHYDCLRLALTGRSVRG